MSKKNKSLMRIFNKKIFRFAMEGLAAGPKMVALLIILTITLHLIDSPWELHTSVLSAIAVWFSLTINLNKDRLLKKSYVESIGKLESELFNVKVSSLNKSIESTVLLINALITMQEKEGSVTYALSMLLMTYLETIQSSPLIKEANKITAPHLVAFQNELVKLKCEVLCFPHNDKEKALALLEKVRDCLANIDIRNESVISDEEENESE